MFPRYETVWSDVISRFGGPSLLVLITQLNVPGEKCVNSINKNWYFPYCICHYDLKAETIT